MDKRLKWLCAILLPMLLSGRALAADQPEAVVRSLVAQEIKCGWGHSCQPKIFDGHPSDLTHRFLTREFGMAWANAIRHNQTVDVWDGNILTGGQGETVLGSVSYKSTVISPVIVSVVTGLRVRNELRTQINYTKFILKFEANTWKVDDIVLMPFRQQGGRNFDHGRSEKQYFVKIDRDNR